MSEIDIFSITDPLIRGSFAALQRAAIEARRIAIATNTNLVRHENGAVVLVTPEALQQEIAREAAA